MPLHAGFSRSKKPKKDSTRRSSMPSTTSHATQPMPRESAAPSVERPKRESTQAQSQSRALTNGNNRGNSQKSLALSHGKAIATKEKAPDVFDFLDDGGSDDGSLSDNSRDHSQSPAKLKSTTTAAPARRASHNAHPQPGLRWFQWASNPSQASSVVSKGSTDSRISPISLDTSPATAQLQLAKKSTARRTPSTEGSQAAGDSAVENSVTKSDWDLSMPDAGYPSPKTATPMHRQPFPPSPPRSPEDNPNRGSRRLRKNSKSSHASSGYGLLASHLTSSADTNHAPLYRRFEHLNHRVLLHIQDEISQMEEDLHVLDEYEEAHRAAAADHQSTKILPASRRMDAHAQAYSSLHCRRQDLIGTLVQKTEQYNNALTAYSRVLHTLPRASETDIKNYRAWLKERNPIAASETRFLDHTNDLVSVLPHSAMHPSTPVYSAIVIASAAILMPLLAFSMISEFSGRLVVVAVVGGAASAIAANYTTGPTGAERLIDSRDGWRCATIYFGFMTIAAMFIP